MQRRYFLFFKQKTAYEMRISDWSSDVCSSDLFVVAGATTAVTVVLAHQGDAAVRLVCLDPDVVRALLRGRELAHFRVAGLVRTAVVHRVGGLLGELHVQVGVAGATGDGEDQDRKSTRLNSSH